jgi:two-component system sensor histidine kinase YesM
MGQDYFYPALESDDWDLSMGFVEDPLLRSSKQVLPVIRPIYHPYNSSMLGWVLVELQPDIFCDALEAYSLDSDSSFYVTIADNVYAYADGALTLLDEPLWDTADTGQALLYTDTAVYASTNGSTRYVTRPLSLSGCYVTQSIPSTRFFAQMPSFLYMLIFITLLVILAGLLYTMYLNRLVNRPIEKILTRIKLISSGDFGRDASIEWDNEFGEIGRGINELSGSVQSLIDNRIKIENEKREYEYRMLQSQINPHFLYNTLNSIKWMASIQHATGIPEMTTALSRLLKSIAKDSRQRVPIETELSFLDDYYTIQKYRYGGGITMEVELEEQSLAANEILRFTLQPIVENAIFHGIEPKGGVGTIKIHIARQGSDVCIDVTDNGVGMDADTLAGLLDGEEQNRSNFFRDIGISNVHRRLRYEYGEAYGLSFTSEPGVYTTVRVMLPGKIYTDTENS